MSNNNQPVRDTSGRLTIELAPEIKEAYREVAATSSPKLTMNSLAVFVREEWVKANHPERTADLAK